MTAMVHGKGRPLRFLALVAIGWVVVRVAILWPQTGSLPEAIRQALPLPSFSPREAPVPEARAIPAAPAPVIPATAVPLRLHHAILPAPASDPVRVELATLGVFQFGAAEYTDAPPGPAAPEAAQTRFDPAPSRWSASGWLTLRQGSGIGAAPGGQLGGSQAGMRIAWLADRRHRIALFGRFVTPLSGPGREAAVGVEWQPVRAPVRLVAEQRIAVDGGKGGPGLGLVAGVDTRIPGGFRLESYGQAGAIRRARIEPYADGAVRATHPIGGTRLALGAGAWGAAQRDAARLDLGPSATLTVPVRGQRFRLALDWRQRVAGDARPGSGVALTLGSDF
ncbi:hypothetical protein OF829_04735 [Sphingomonas sp. LB-2]|uniref:hypothetical protein n=1 Tax=Sphingomonas caeni TaxID=2984949 RepID=UPI00222FDF3C|nr:hypothetical protein [Sphingomonas caeni]MCW3846534.1 hypothetical protein [Sphingomonas caeni]